MRRSSDRPIDAVEFLISPPPLSHEEAVLRWTGISVRSIDLDCQMGRLGNRRIGRKDILENKDFYFKRKLSIEHLIYPSRHID
jgi:hypothetical protein